MTIKMFSQRKFKVGDLVYPKGDYFSPSNIAKDYYDRVVQEWNRTGCPFEVIKSYTNCFGTYCIEVEGISEGLTEEMFDLYSPTENKQKQFSVPDEWLSEWVEEYCPLKKDCQFWEYINNEDNQPLPEELPVVPEPERVGPFPWYEVSYKNGDRIRALSIDELEERVRAEGTYREPVFWEIQEKLQHLNDYSLGNLENKEKYISFFDYYRCNFHRCISKIRIEKVEKNND